MHALEMNRLIDEFLSCLLSARAAQDQGSNSGRAARLKQASKPYVRIERFAHNVIAQKWPMLNDIDEVALEVMTRLATAFLAPGRKPPSIDNNSFNYVYTVILNTARDALRVQIEHERNQAQVDSSDSPGPIAGAPGWASAHTVHEPHVPLLEPVATGVDTALRLDVLTRLTQFEQVYNHLPAGRMPHPDMLRHICLDTPTYDIAQAWFERAPTVKEENRVKKWKEATRNVAQLFFADLNTTTQ
jgi:hypothetical protein